jgi:hypothetical protein
MQSEFTRQQVEAAEAQLENSRSQFQEQVRQGLASSRPNFKFRDGEPGFSTSAVVIRNTGPGVAYRITWRFVNPKNRQLENSVYKMGTLAANHEMPIPWDFDKQNPRLQTRMMVDHDIRVECMDGAGRLYYTIVKMNEQGDFITHSDQIEPDS